MAQLGCTLCDAEQAVILLTNLDDGSTTSVGVSCLPVFALSMAQSCTDDLPDASADDFGPLFDAIAANDRRPKPSPAASAGAPSGRGKRARSAAAATPASTTQGTPDGSEAAAEAADRWAQDSANALSAELDDPTSAVSAATTVSDGDTEQTAQSTDDAPF